MTEEHVCKLLGGFGVFIQGLLGTICFIALIVKRYREIPRRPWSIFIMDSSKQLAGTLTIHMLNLLCAGVFSSLKSGEACGWYWINIMVDCTLGVFVLSWYFEKAKQWFNIEALTNFGDYGSSKPWRAWAYQALIWQLFVISMKITMVIFMFILHVPLAAVAYIVLYPVHTFPRMKLIVVMVITPLIMNTLQVVIIDNIIKRKEKNPIGSTSSNPPPQIIPGNAQGY